jgi:sugar phosphate isomerase/epimerase
VAKTVKGPGIFLAQFAADQAPFNDLAGITKWAGSIGFKAVQIPSWDLRFFDVEMAAQSKTYCDDVLGICAEAGMVVSELSTHMQGQMVAVHPAYDQLFDAVVPPQVRNNKSVRTEWAERQVRAAALASRNMGLNTIVSFSGSFAFPYHHPWPQRSDAFIDTAYTELATRWRPLLDFCDECGVDVAFELNPGEDIFDGTTFEMFLDKLGGHPRCNINYDPSHFVLQQLKYLDFIDIYHERIKAFHVKDAEFNPTGRQGVYSGQQRWVNRAARFRSPGDGQVDFRSVFSKLTQYGFDRWAVLEWECPIKHPEAGAREGARLIEQLIIEATNRDFDDYIPQLADAEDYKFILGISG